MIQAFQRLSSVALVAIHHTIKFLNDDASLEVLKETLPRPTLMQLRNNRRRVSRRARARPSASTMALRGKSVDFTKDIAMIVGDVTPKPNPGQGHQ